MREKQVFTNEDIDIDEVIYNYVEIVKLHQMIRNLEISTEDFILICYLIGNDFMPGLLTTDIKKGLDKIIQAYKKVIEKDGLCLINKDNNKIESFIITNKDNKYNINHDLLKKLFRELLWTEKHVWKNINRDRILNQDNLEQEELEKIKFLKQDEKNNLIKFVNGESNNTNFIDKIQFNSKFEYYNYYLE